MNGAEGRDELARAIYELSPWETNVNKETGKLLGYSRKLKFEELGWHGDSFYILADGILAAGYRKVAPPVPFEVPDGGIAGPWHV